MQVTGLGNCSDRLWERFHISQKTCPQNIYFENPDAVVTPKLSLSQEFEPDVNELKVGDSIKRTITVTATDTVAMLLPTIVPT